MNTLRWILARSALSASALAALAASAHVFAADPSSTVVAADASERLTARTPLGHREFTVLAPNALVSDAELLPANVKDAEANAKSEPGHRLFAKVVVRLNDPADSVRIDAAAKALGLASTAERFSNTPGPISEFWTITTPSVRQAIALADALAQDPAIREAVLDTQRPRTLRALPTDPGVAQQWYFNNPPKPAATLNVEPAWDAGFIGTGITVGIVESGFNSAHPDLAANFNAAASQSPPFAPGFINHGTACAGLVAAVANNAIGGAGVAYGAKIARQYYGSDTDTAAAWLFAEDINSIKSNSWGPPDSATLGTISSIEDAALTSGVLSGRNGKGTIFVWAAGNGGQIADRTDYDQYASHRSAIAVGAADNKDQLAIYSELGSSLMFVTTSSTDFAGSGGSGIYSTTGADTSAPGTYTTGFGGTSAAAPIASGVIALVLQARPALSWRDVQHVLVRTARRIDPTDDGWTTNGAGRWINERYGFGALNAAAAVALAQTFPLKGPEVSFISAEQEVNLPIPDSDASGISSTIRVPSNFSIEKAQIVLTAPHNRLGDLRVELVSPAGTTSLLAATRSDTSFGYSSFTFTTSRNWDERAKGNWKLTIADPVAGSIGTFNRWQLKLFGSVPTCPGDWNADNVINLDDIFIFLTDWFAGLGDFDNNGASNLDDVFTFINQWFATVGCTGP